MSQTVFGVLNGSRPLRRLWIGAAAFAAVVLTAGLGTLSTEKWPFSRSEIQTTLERRFARKVTIGVFAPHYFPPGCVAEDVQFLQREHPDRPALITIRRVTIRGSWSGLIAPHKRIPAVLVEGLHVSVPPPTAAMSKPITPLAEGASRQVEIGDIEASGAMIDFLSAHSDRPAFQISLRSLHLGGVGADKPISFQAFLHNTEPPFDAQTSGQFGPWNADHPSNTPLEGKYRTENIDLAAFGSISGKVAGSGTFRGSLAQLGVEGDAQVPQFHLKGAGGSVPLSAHYRAAANTTNGDVVLEHVETHVLQTSMMTSGTISGVTAGANKDTLLRLSIRNGRVDDFLRIFGHGPTPAMFGRLDATMNASIPHGAGRFLRKLRLDGDVTLAEAKFSKATTQGRINRLSESALGETRKDERSDERTFLMTVRGHAVARDGVAHLTGVSTESLGAHARMGGTFNLVDHGVDLTGELKTEGRVTDNTSGFESLILHIASPLIKKNGVTTVPFKITGTSEHAHCSLRLFGKQKH